MQRLAWFTELLGVIMLVASAWEERVQALCTQSCMYCKCLNGSGPAYLADSLRRVTDVQSRRRLRSSSPSSLIVPVNGDTSSCNRRCVSGRRRPAPGLGTAYQTTSRQRQPSHHCVLRWRRNCFPGLSDTGNMRHTDLVTWFWSAVVPAPRYNPVVWWRWFPADQALAVRVWTDRHDTGLATFVFLWSLTIRQDRSPLVRHNVSFHRGRYLVRCCLLYTADQLGLLTLSRCTASSSIITPTSNDTLLFNCPCTPTTPPTVSPF